MIIAQISRYDTKERVLGNSWLLKLFMVPIQILFLTYFWRKKPFLIKMTSQNDGLLSMDTLLNQNIKIYIVNTMLLFTSYHKQIQTFTKIHSRQIRNRFLSEKWPISQKNDVHVKIVILKCHFWKNGFWNQNDHFYRDILSGQFWPCIFIRKILIF